MEFTDLASLAGMGLFEFLGSICLCPSYPSVGI